MAVEVTDDQKAAMQGMLNGVYADMSHLATKLRPSDSDPDAPLSFGGIRAALAGCPSLSEIGSQCSAASVSSIAVALDAVGAIDDALDGLDAAARANGLLLSWQLNREQHGVAESMALDEATSRQASAVLQTCTKLLMQAQMLIPKQRWVQQTLAVARASALVANSLWSHSDEAALALQTAILAREGLRYPRLELSASTPKQVLPKAPVEITVLLARQHAGGSEAAKMINNQGIFEAYWLYVEGHKPKETPNSLLAAQPMPVKDVDAPHVEAQVVFTAPPTLGKYQLTVHVLSTSVIGVELSQDVMFEVVEDDVPALE
uniref:SEC63 domain-containing protein n=1 Tax=Calcidiscus leptoporus TaxID=127549 RepID=A0A7S0NTP6_9EUKA|mmetsp:Transcript_25166/g.58641  ORF Transcript_25166/g.58641 Transcript_25166/m.58641 type:complete len:318 (+) Transcript_25166:15-968(+)